MDRKRIAELPPAYWRKEGFYWIKIPGWPDWRVAEFSRFEGWLITGDDAPIEPEDIEWVCGPIEMEG